MYPSRETHSTIGTIMLHPSKVAFLPCGEIPLMKTKWIPPKSTCSLYIFPFVPLIYILLTNWSGSWLWFWSCHIQRCLKLRCHSRDLPGQLKIHQVIQKCEQTLGISFWVDCYKRKALFSWSVTIVFQLEVSSSCDTIGCTKSPNCANWVKLGKTFGATSINCNVLKIEMWKGLNHLIFNHILFSQVGWLKR